MARGVLCLHGFTGSPKDLKELGVALEQRLDAVVSIPTLPGHNGNPDELKNVTGGDWFAAAQEAYQVLVAQTDGNVAIVGNSFGANLAFAIAVGQSPKAIVALSPPARIQWQLPIQLALPLLQLFMKEYRKPKRGNLANEEIPGFQQTAYDRIPLSALKELLVFLEHTMQPDLLARVSGPLLYIQGSNDPVVAPWSSRYFRDHLGSQPKEFILWKERFHLIVQGERKYELYEVIGNWIGKYL